MGSIPKAFTAGAPIAWAPMRYRGFDEFRSDMKKMASACLLIPDSLLERELWGDDRSSSPSLPFCPIGRLSGPLSRQSLSRRYRLTQDLSRLGEVCERAFLGLEVQDVRSLFLRWLFLSCSPQVPSSASSR